MTKFAPLTALSTLAVTAALLVGQAAALDGVKIMIGANPGGGYDQTGRGIGKALTDAGAAKSVQYENKGGAGGTIGLAQFASASKGDPNAMVVTGAVMVGAIVQQSSNAVGGVKFQGVPQLTVMLDAQMTFGGSVSTINNLCVQTSEVLVQQSVAVHIKS